MAYSIEAWELGIIALLEGIMLSFTVIQLVGVRVGINKVNAVLNGMKNPETRMELFREGAHGIMKALAERSGAEKGAAKRTEIAAITENLSSGATGLGDVMSMMLGDMKGNFNIGGFKIPKSIAAQFAMQYLLPRLQAGGLLQMQAQQSSGAGLPP